MEQPDSTVHVAADIADAIDPNLTPDARIDAAKRAVQADPEAAIILATSITGGLIAELGSQRPGGSEGIMRKVRQGLSTIPHLPPV